jgi:hypothetical protein
MFTFSFVEKLDFGGETIKSQGLFLFVILGERPQFYWFYLRHLKLSPAKRG